MRIQYPKRIRTTVLLFLLVFISGSPLLNNEAPIKVVLPLFFLICLFLSTFPFKRSLLAPALALGATFSVVFLAQTIEYSIFQLAYISFLMKLFCGAVVIHRAGDDFPRIYTNIIVFLSAISIPLFALQAIIGYDSMPGFQNPFSSTEQKSLLLFTMVANHSFRNSGFTWEPGAFQGFINIAFIFISIAKVKTDKRERLKFWILVISLLTTASTTGYLCFLLLLTYKLVAESKLPHTKLAIAGVAAFGIPLTIYSLDFLWAKIIDQYYFAIYSNEFFGDRLSSIKFDIPYILEAPIIGNGYVEETRWRLNPEFFGRTLGHGNGFTAFIASNGLAAAAVYFGFLFRSLKSHGNPYLLTLMIVLLLQGEHFLNHALFLGLPFILAKAYDHQNRDARI